MRRARAGNAGGRRRACGCDRDDACRLTRIRAVSIRASSHTRARGGRCRCDSPPRRGPSPPGAPRPESLAIASRSDAPLPARRADDRCRQSVPPAPGLLRPPARVSGERPPALSCPDRRGSHPRGETPSAPQPESQYPCSAKRPRIALIRATRVVCHCVRTRWSAGNVCCSTVFTGTGRMSSHRAASTRASVSVRSVLLRRTYGRTYWTGSSRTRHPRDCRRRPQ